MTSKLLVFLTFVALVHGQVEFLGFVEKWSTIAAISKSNNGTGSDGKFPVEIIKFSEIESIQKVVPQWIPKPGDKDSGNSTSDKKNGTSTDFVKIIQFEDVKKVFTKWSPNLGGQNSDNSTTKDQQNSTSPIKSFIEITKIEDIKEKFTKGVSKFTGQTADNSTKETQ